MREFLVLGKFAAFQDSFPIHLSVRAIAKSANVSKTFITKVAAELASTGQLTDPDIAKDETDNRVSGAFLRKEEAVFLLPSCKLRAQVVPIRIMPVVG